MKRLERQIEKKMKMKYFELKKKFIFEQTMYEWRWKVRNWTTKKYNYLRLSKTSRK